MNTLGVSAYGTVPGAQDDQGLESSATADAQQPTGSSLDMNDFLRLLAAQFQNQDVMNPTDNTQFIAELAQFSSLQAMNQLNQYADRQYAASLVGKTVVVGQYDDSGKYSEQQGTVESAYFSSDGTVVVVGNTAYDLSSVIQVIQDASSSNPDPNSDPSPDPAPDPDPDPGTGGTEG